MQVTWDQLKSREGCAQHGTDQKKIKMIESERASERAGGPARKQEYVVVKKKNY